MYSAFASPSIQEDLPPFSDKLLVNPNIWRHKKYAEFILYKLPLMLESHSSSPTLNTASQSKPSTQYKEHKRQRSILFDNVGIIACNNVKTVTFGVPCTLVYKKDIV